MWAVWTGTGMREEEKAAEWISYLFDVQEHFSRFCKTHQSRSASRLPTAATWRCMNMYAYTWMCSHSSENPTSHAPPLLPRSFNSFKDRHVSTREPVSAVSWSRHLDRKKEGSATALPPVWSPETGHCTQTQNPKTDSRPIEDKRVPVIHFTLHVIVRTPRRRCPPVASIIYIRPRPREMKGTTCCWKDALNT